jgi:hypothetical protein
LTLPELFRRIRDVTNTDADVDGKNAGRLLEIARVLVRFDLIARVIVNANHGIM